MPDEHWLNPYFNLGFALKIALREIEPKYDPKSEEGSMMAMDDPARKVVRWIEKLVQVGGAGTP